VAGHRFSTDTPPVAIVDGAVMTGAAVIAVGNPAGAGAGDIGG